jgi:hypothetical protein
MSFHLIYRPGSTSGQSQDTIISLLHSDNRDDVLLQLQAIPDAVAMELDAIDEREAVQELRELGF